RPAEGAAIAHPRQEQPAFVEPPAPPHLLEDPRDVRGIDVVSLERPRPPHRRRRDQHDARGPCGRQPAPEEGAAVASAAMECYDKRRRRTRLSRLRDEQRVTAPAAALILEMVDAAARRRLGLEPGA